MIDYSSKRVATLQIYYFRSDYKHIVQEFSWQYDDVHPRFPRTHKFLKHWHEHIDAVIQEILFAHHDKYKSGNIRPVETVLDLSWMTKGNDDG